MNINVSQIHNCYGCGVCSASCGKKIISIELNRDGFYEPRIKEPDKCTNCGICLDVCAFNHQERAFKPEEISIKSWAAWSNDENIRRKCSSGGIGFEIGKQLIEQGYKAVGCRYDIKEQRAEHYIATTVEEFIQSIGSKYIQSYTEEAFKQINRKGEKYLVTGTPCQIDSFRRMIRKFRCEDNFILMDFYCHSVPSMHAWRSYLNYVMPRTGKIIEATWRNKDNLEWHKSYNLSVKGEKGEVKSAFCEQNLFLTLFLSDFCPGTQCLKNCKYKYDKSSADIRIGDLWGTTYANDTKGISALISFTEKGHKVIKSLKNVTLVEHPFEVVAEGQMRDNTHQKETTPIFRYLLRKDVPLSNPIYSMLFFSQKVIGKLKHILHL